MNSSATSSKKSLDKISNINHITESTSKEIIFDPFLFLVDNRIYFIYILEIIPYTGISIMKKKSEPDNNLFPLCILNIISR